MTDQGDQYRDQQPPSWEKAPPPPPPPPPYDPNPRGGVPPYGQPPYGQPYGQPYGPVPETEANATTVLVLGIMSIVLTFSCGIGFILAIVALVMAPQAMRNIEASQGMKTGESLVKAGRICSYISLGLAALVALALIAWIVLVVGIGAIGATGAASGY